MSQLKSTLAFCLLLFSISFTNYASSEPSVFSKTSFENLKKQKLGKRWLLILWSVDCPACFKELELIQKLRENMPDIEVVIVNADDNDEITIERQNILNTYNLSSLSNYYFGDGLGDQSRYLIDKNWYGELPRSYFIDENGKFHGKSGLVKEDLLKKWLVPELK